VQLLHLDYLNIFDWVWNTSARVSVLIILLLLVKYVLKNQIGARLHYLLWFVVIVSLLLPWTPQSSFSLYNLTNLEMQKTSPINEGAKTSPPSASVNVGFSSEETGNPLEQIAVAQNPQHFLFNTGESLKSIATSPFTQRLLFFIWIMGIAVFIAATVLVNRRFVQRMKGQSVVDTKLLMALKEAKNKLNIKAEVPLIQTMEITSPSLFGLFSPRLLIPVGILEEFNSEQLNHVFVHELLHLKRKDVLVNWLTRGLLILHWFNPILWYAFYKLREDQEIACDAITLEHIGINDAKEYAYTLIKLVETNSRLSRITSLANLSGSRSQIRRRITMLKFFHKATLKWSLLAVTVVGALAFVTLTTATNASTPNTAGIAKVSTTNTVKNVETVANVVPQNNPQAVKIEPNKLVTNEGWSLSIVKVLNLGGSKEGFGWHSPYKESDTARSYGLFFYAENAMGKDKAFLPKGKVLGAVGTSGKFYKVYKGYDSIDQGYNGENWSSIGKPNSPGVFKFSTGVDVDLNENGITKVIYQDENGNRIEIPVNIKPTIFTPPKLETVVKPTGI